MFIEFSVLLLILEEEKHFMHKYLENQEGRHKNVPMKSKVEFTHPLSFFGLLPNTSFLLQSTVSYTSILSNWTVEAKR